MAVRLYSALRTDPLNFDMMIGTPGSGVPRDYTNERVWDGDWTKGPAGGYGTNQTTWGGMCNLDDLKVGYLADKITWTVDAAKKQVTTTLEVRQGIHWALNTNSDASRLLNGRELTADDIVYCMNMRMDDPRAWMNMSYPDVKGLKATKTGAWEVQMTLPMATYMTERMILFDGGLIFPQGNGQIW